jgi:pyruvate kinase
MSASRPAAPIVGICADTHAARIAGLLWGMLPVPVKLDADTDPHRLARQAVLDLELAQAGQSILVIQGFSTDPALNRPSVTILTV